MTFISSSMQKPPVTRFIHPYQLLEQHTVKVPVFHQQTNLLKRQPVSKIQPINSLEFCLH